MKIAAAALLVTVTVLNVHAALKSYYGINKGGLAGQVWAQASSLNSESGTGSSSSAILGQGTPVGCYVNESFPASLTIYGNYTSSASFTLAGNTVTGVTLGSSGTVSYTQTNITIVTAGSKQDCPGWNGWCSTTACSYPVGTKPYGVFYGGVTIAAKSTSGSSSSN